MIIRVANGTKLGAAASHRVVFEVDQIASDLLNGWTVVVHGVASEPEKALFHWTGNRDHPLRIHHYSGRAVR